MTLFNSHYIDVTDHSVVDLHLIVEGGLPLTGRVDVLMTGGIDYGGILTVGVTTPTDLTVVR